MISDGGSLVCQSVGSLLKTQTLFPSFFKGLLLKLHKAKYLSVSFSVPLVSSGIKQCRQAGTYEHELCAIE